MSWTRNDFMILQPPFQSNVFIQILERDEVSNQERTKFLNILCKMCSRQRSLPKSMFIPCCHGRTTEERHGGHATVFKGECRGRQIAIKVLRLRPTDSLEVRLGVCLF